MHKNLDFVFHGFSVDQPILYVILDSKQQLFTFSAELKVGALEGILYK